MEALGREAERQRRRLAAKQEEADKALEDIQESVEKATAQKQVADGESGCGGGLPWDERMPPDPPDHTTVPCRGGLQSSAIACDSPPAKPRVVHSPAMCPCRIPLPPPIPSQEAETLRAQLAVEGKEQLVAAREIEQRLSGVQPAQGTRGVLGVSEGMLCFTLLSGKGPREVSLSAGRRAGGGVVGASSLKSLLSPRLFPPLAPWLCAGCGAGGGGADPAGAPDGDARPQDAPRGRPVPRPSRTDPKATSRGTNGAQGKPWDASSNRRRTRWSGSASIQPGVSS